MATSLKISGASTTGIVECVLCVNLHSLPKCDYVHTVCVLGGVFSSYFLVFSTTSWPQHVTGYVAKSPAGFGDLILQGIVAVCSSPLGE